MQYDLFTLYDDGFFRRRRADEACLVWHEKAQSWSVLTVTALAAKGYCTSCQMSEFLLTYVR